MPGSSFSQKGWRSIDGHIDKMSLFIPLLPRLTVMVIRSLGKVPETFTSSQTDGEDKEHAFWQATGSPVI